jgi:hypothetical protein
MRSALLPSSLLVALAAAGCLQASVPPPMEPAFDPHWSERALPWGDGHDHGDPAHHAGLSTPNFEVVGHDLLWSEHYQAPPGATFCGDASEVPGGRRIAAVESRSEVGFTLVDVTNASDPETLGELVMENTRVYDLAVVPDGRHVVLVTQGLENTPVALPPLLRWRGPCLAGGAVVPVPAPAAAHAALAGEDPLPRPSSILLVDISDPAAPAVVDHHPLYGYGHSAYSTILDGRAWIVATTTGPATRASAYESTSAFEFYEVVATPAGERLRLLSLYKPQQDLRGAGPPVELGPRGHDAWIARHPGTGQTLAYLAAWERLEVLDLADPMQPRRIGAWTDLGPGRAGHGGAIHSVLPLPELHGGRHLTVVGPEWHGHPAGHPSGIIWVLDTTDPAAPVAVAGWTLPHEVEWSGEFMFSNHYYGMHGRTLFVSMYHGGVWAVDLGPVLAPPGPRPAFTGLESVGVFLPTAPEAEVAVEQRWAPTVEEALVFPDGTLLTFDGRSGAWAFRFDEARPAPPPPPWPITPP